MALIKCSKCGGKLSTHAIQCPHCGCSMAEAVATSPNPIKSQSNCAAGLQEKQTVQSVKQFEISLGHLVRFIGTGGAVLIPDGVKFIEDGAFENSAISGVRFPLSRAIERIGKYSFRGCRNLQVVILPIGLVEIGDGCFEGCSSLERLILPKSIRAIPPHAFSFCGKLKKIIIPPSVEVISNDAFIGTSIREVTLPDKFEEQVPSLFPSASIVHYSRVENEPKIAEKHGQSQLYPAALTSGYNEFKETECPKSANACEVESQVSVRQNEEPAEQDSVQSGKREKMAVCPKCCSIVSNYAGVCPRCKAILSSNRTTNLNTANSQKASSASWLDEYKKNTLKADSGTSKYHSLQETEISGDWRREELRRSDLRKDEAKIEKVYTSPTSNFYYDYDETDCGPDSLSDSYWDYHGCD